MQDSAVVMVIAVSLMGGGAILGMILLTIRSIVRIAQLTSLKTKCLARGMSAADIERVVLVGLDRSALKRRAGENEDEILPLEKSLPPVLASRAYAAAR